MDQDDLDAARTKAEGGTSPTAAIPGLQCIRHTGQHPPRWLGMTSPLRTEPACLTCNENLVGNPLPIANANDITDRFWVANFPLLHLYKRRAAAKWINRLKKELGFLWRR